MIRVGPAGWSYPDWEGIVYPAGKPRGFHPLPHLAGFLDCVELNSSFYATPRADHARRWVELVADRPDFRFLAKLEGIYTHQPLPATDDELELAAGDYLAGIEPLRASGKLSGVLLQFPHSFRWGPRGHERLRRLDGCFGHLPLVLEVRHISWYDPEPLAAVEALGLSLAEIDLPPASTHPPPRPPRIGPVGYLRLHGRNTATWFSRSATRDTRYDYLYGPDELEELVRTTRRLATGRDETFVVTNNHFGGKAVANAIEILVALGRPEDPKPLVPPELVQAFPRLGPLTRTGGQGSLF